MSRPLTIGERQKLKKVVARKRSRSPATKPSASFLSGYAEGFQATSAEWKEVQPKPPEVAPSTPYLLTREAAKIEQQRLAQDDLRRARDMMDASVYREMVKAIANNEPWPPAPEPRAAGQAEALPEPKARPSLWQRVVAWWQR